MATTYTLTMHRVAPKDHHFPHQRAWKHPSQAVPDAATADVASERNAQRLKRSKLMHPAPVLASSSYAKSSRIVPTAPRQASAQRQETLGFEGPKSLTQIKAEKQQLLLRQTQATQQQRNAVSVGIQSCLPPLHSSNQEGDQVGTLKDALPSSQKQEQKSGHLRTPIASTAATNFRKDMSEARVGLQRLAAEDECCTELEEALTCHIGFPSSAQQQNCKDARERCAMADGLQQKTCQLELDCRIEEDDLELEVADDEEEFAKKLQSVLFG